MYAPSFKESLIGENRFSILDPSKTTLKLIFAFSNEGFVTRSYYLHSVLSHRQSKRFIASLKDLICSILGC